MFRNDDLLGAVVLAMPLSAILDNLGLAPEFGVSILAPASDGSWSVLAQRGVTAPESIFGLAASQGFVRGPGDFFVLAAPWPERGPRPGCACSWPTTPRRPRRPSGPRSSSSAGSSCPARRPCGSSST